MNKKLVKVINMIAKEYKGMILRGSRNYIEISIGEHSERLGHTELKDKYRHTYAIVPLKEPQRGMKVRIDGRTFVNYAEHASGIAIPGYLASEAGLSVNTFVPNDSMICNFT